MSKKKKRNRDNRIVTADAYLAKIAKTNDDLNRKIIEREKRIRKEREDATKPRTSSGYWSGDPLHPRIRIEAVAAPRPTQPRTDRRIYFAYGSNMSPGQMRARCPGSSRLYVHNMQGFKLEFQRHANIVEGAEDDYVPGMLWLITPEDEKALDRYEGVAHNSYQKKTFKYFTKKGNWRDVLYYQKTPGPLVPPTQYYLNIIVEGYKAYGLTFDKLNEAIIAANTAWENRPKEKKQPAARKATEATAPKDSRWSEADLVWITQVREGDFSTAELKSMLSDPIWNWTEEERDALLSLIVRQGKEY